MIQDDPIQKLREVYEVWSQFKQSVSGWFQTNGWLIELGVVGVVGFVMVAVLGGLIFVGILSATSHLTASQKPSDSPAMSVKAYWEERKKQQGIERKEHLGEGGKPDGETNNLRPWWTKPVWGVVFAVLFIGYIAALLIMRP